jgi:hypothetical protein
MSNQTDFKSLITGKVFTINLNINSKISVLYPHIKSKLLSMIGSPTNSTHDIVLKTLNHVILEETSDECFANFCDSINYPALYFQIYLNEITEVD